MSEILMSDVTTWCSECGTELPKSNAQVVLCTGCGTEYEIYKGPLIHTGHPPGTPLRAMVGSNFPLTCAHVIEEAQG